MADAIDYMIESDGSWKIQNGDFVKADCTQKHQQSLLIAQKGEYKQSPTTGVGIVQYLLDEKSSRELKSIITKEFEDDGITIDSLKVSNGSINIESHYG